MLAKNNVRKTRKAKQFIDLAISIQGGRISKVFVNIVGKQLGARIRPIWSDWKKNHGSYNTMSSYIDALANEIDILPLRMEFIDKSLKILAAPPSQEDIIQYRSNLGKGTPAMAMASDLSANSISACINGDGL